MDKIFLSIRGSTVVFADTTEKIIFVATAIGAQLSA